MPAVWKLVVSLFSLLIMAISVAFGVLAIGLEDPSRIVKLVFGTQESRVITLAVAVFLLIVALQALVKALARTTETTVLIQETPSGSVMITIPAIKQIIMKAVRSIDGVREIRPAIKTGKNGIAVSLEVMVDPDHKLPETTSAIQDKVRQDLEDIGGLRVASIKVTVDDMVTRSAAK